MSGIEMKISLGDILTAFIAFIAVIVSLYTIWISNKSSAVQQFENTFFQLLKFQNQIVKSMDLRSRDTVDLVVSRGRDCFKTVYLELRGEVYNEKKRQYFVSNPNGEFHDESKKRPLEWDEIIKIYTDKIFPGHQGDLGHYFRNLYNLIRFVDESDAIKRSEEKQKYIRIIRAQLSNYELMVLYYNAMSTYGIQNFKPLIDKYNLLDNVNVKLKIDYSNRKPDQFYEFEKKQQKDGTFIK